MPNYGSGGAVAMDNRGPPHLLTVVDRTTRWAEAIPFYSTTAQEAADSFVANWVSRVEGGVPATITTD